MNSYNIVTNYKIIQTIKSGSKYFRLNLGLSSTINSNSGDRTYNQKDDFAYFYNTMYKATILGQGSIGNIKIYTDHYIKEDKIAFYFNKEEFIFDFDSNIVKEKGIDFYLGHLIKTIEIEYEDRLKKKEDEVESKKNIKANADKVFKNPGAVSYEDLKAYLEKQRQERLKINQ
jgi:hypothetical protein